MSTSPSSSAKAAVEPPLGTCRRWRHLTARVFTAPACVEPALFASSPQTQFMLQLSGAMDLSVNTDGRERRYRTQPGSLSLTSAHLPDFEMAWRSLSPEPIRLLELCLDDELLAQTAAVEAGLDAARLELHDGSGLDDPLLQVLGQAIVQELDAPESQSELYADTAARMLAVQLVRRHGTVRPRERVFQAAGLPPQTLRRLDDYVRAHLGGAVTLEALSGVAGLSPYHFARAFRRTTGQSPNGFVIAQRLAHAAHLLRRTRLTVAHVASEVGYQDARHFSRLFRRQFGCSPARWGQDRLG